MLEGFLHLSWVGDIIAGLILTHITIVSITVYLHRHQSHKALELSPIISHFFRFWLWLTTGMVTKEWVAIHRKHHAECETINDPHSPQIFGIRKVLLEGAELYRAEGKNSQTLERYGMGTPDDWVERNIYTRFSSKGIFLMLILDIFFFGLIGISIWGVQMLWTPLFAAGIINGVGHFAGYRNFECPDASRNLFPIAILIGGEELHNNHHTYPFSAKLSVKWWEFDMGWFYISLLQKLGLATVKRIPPKFKRIKNKTEVDAETLGALFTNRFQIMAHYSQEVIFPVLQAERTKLGAKGQVLLQKAKSLLVRSESLIDEKSKDHLQEILSASDALEQVYGFRQRLQAIWERTAASQKELLEALQEWCKQAENAGISALRDFSTQLKTYVLASAR